MREIAERQNVNICTNLSIAGGNNINVPIDLRFHADEMTIRSLSYTAAADAATLNLQLVCSIAVDPIIAIFSTANVGAGAPISYTQSLENRVQVQTKFRTGTINFQVQVCPSSGGNTGSGNLVSNAIVTGNLAIFLEFVKWA